MHTILIGKTGATVDVDESKFAAHVNEYVFKYGLTQILNDAHSTVTEKAEPDRDARVAQVNALVAKKLEALYSGEVRSNGGGRTGDPVASEAKRIATSTLRAKIKASGKKWDDFADEAIRGAVAKLIESNPDIMAEAKANVAARAEKAKGVDLLALGL